MASKMLEVVLEEEQREWCVDLGGMLAPMDEAELCAAIDRGDVTHEMRVWRAGLDGWTPVEDLPELAPTLRLRGGAATPPLRGGSPHVHDQDR